LAKKVEAVRHDRADGRMHSVLRRASQLSKSLNGLFIHFFIYLVK